MKISQRSRLLSVGTGFFISLLISAFVLGGIFVPADLAQAAVAYRASATTCNATANTSVNVPAGTQNGDVMIMVINSKDNAVQSTPTGWTRIGTQLNNGANLTTNIFYRAASSEPASYAPTTTTVSHCLGISSFSGVDNTNPINASSQRANASSSTITANAITPNVTNTEVIFISGYANNVTHSGYSGTNPTFTERYDALTTLGSDNAIALASGAKTDTVSTGNRTATASGGAAVNNGYLIALAPQPVNINISGTCKQADGSTDCTDTGTIKIAVNGTLQAQTQETVGGAWTISGVSQPASGAVITVFVDGVASSETRAVAVTTYDGSGDIAGLELIEGALSLGNSDNRTITNTNLSQYDNSQGDADVFHDVSTNLTVDTNNSIANELLYIKSGNTFAPGGNVVTASYKNNGTFTASTNTVNFKSLTGTPTLSGNLNSGSAFYKISFDTATGTASWTIKDAMAATAANAADTFVVKNGTVTLGDGSGDNLDVRGKLVIAGTAGETGTFQSAAVSQGSTIIIDINANASSPTCANCQVFVGATSGAGQGNFKIGKNTILRLNPRATATASDTGVEVQSTGYLEILGTQETTNTISSLTQNTSGTTLAVTGTPWTAGQFDGMHVRFTSTAGPSFGKVFNVSSTTASTIEINAVTTATDTNPQVQTGIACSGSGNCAITVADNLFTASREHVGSYLHNITDDKYYLIASTTEDTVDKLGIVTNSPDDFTTMDDGDDVEITEGVRTGDAFEIIDYAHVTAESGTACSSAVGGAGEGYIRANGGSETLIRYADICNLGRDDVAKFGIVISSVNGANANEGATIDRSRLRSSRRGVVLISASNNTAGKGILGNLISGSQVGVYFNGSSNNSLTQTRILDGSLLGVYLENGNSNNLLSDNSIYQNSIHGVLLTSSSRNKVTGNKIYRNGTVADQHHGLFLNTSSANNVLDQNIVYDNKAWGIVEDGSNNTTISNSTLHNNGKSGIVISNSRHATVFNNASFNNGFHGLTQICSTVDDSTMLLFGNSFYNNDLNGLMLESAFDCAATVINDNYGGLGNNGVRDLYMGAAGAPTPGNHKMNLYNVTAASTNEVSLDEMVNVDHFIISRKHDATNGSTKVWGKYVIPANDTETPQDESKAQYNYADGLWAKSASHHGYSGTGTEDANLDYDLTTADLSGGPYHYRVTVKTAGNCSTAVFDVFRNNVDAGDASCGVQFTDATTAVKFKVDGGGTAYVVGDSYTFNVWDTSGDSDTQKAVTMKQDKDTFTVPAGTTLELKGLATTTPTLVTRGGTGGYQFSVSGTLDSNGYKFDYLGGTGQNAGLVLNSGSTITSLDNGSFDNFAVNNGTADAFVQVDSSLLGASTTAPSLIVTGINFENTTGNANCNLNASGSAAGFWESLLYTGVFAGESFDCANGSADADPGNFKWTPPLP